jgi:hypothetical protein
LDPWSNIESSTQDTEIAEINKLETTLDDIPTAIRKIRELITRFEVCHFKYQQHIKHIQTSILALKHTTDPDKIGTNHISRGEKAWPNDKTGRSLVGQKYLWALKSWLIKTDKSLLPKDFDKRLYLKITSWLGIKTHDKERIVRLLIARLTYSWGAYKKFQKGGHLKDLEYQTCRMDICHYAFPKHLDTLIQAIGELKPHKDLEGCGSFNFEIKSFIKKKYSEICQSIDLSSQNKNDLMRTWLYLCLAKTIKEQTGITDPIPGLKKVKI